MALPGNTDNEKLTELCSRTYKEQAVWFLNAFWDDFESEAENCWKYVHLYGELDLERKNDGNGLDELNAHRFLEKNNETLTVSELRNKLRSSGAIGQTERPKTVPITHYLLFKYQVDWKVLVNSCGDNSAEIAKAQSLLDEVNAAFEVARSTAEEARRQEAPFKAAQEELEAAVAALQAEEDAYNSKKDELTRKGEGSGVSAMKAKNELAQLLAEDPLPLRRAKITQEAALKKAEALRAPFEKARAAAEAALDDATAKVAEAEAYLAEVKAKPGSPHGAIWWMERELHEAKAYLPTSKGGYKKN